MLQGYIHVNMASDINSRKSSYMITFVEELMSWKTVLQECVAYIH